MCCGIIQAEDNLTAASFFGGGGCTVAVLAARDGPMCCTYVLYVCALRSNVLYAGDCEWGTEDWFRGKSWHVHQCM